MLSSEKIKTKAYQNILQNLKEKNIIKFKNSCLIIKEIVNVLMGDFNTTMIISFTI